MSKRNYITNLVAYLLLAGISFSCSQKHYTDPLSPEEEMKHFDLDDKFGISLFASEPNVKSPVDMVFDEQGNIYVVEMFDYPYQPEPGKGSGRIRVLKDTDGDEKMDSAVVFANNLPSATSMLPWQGGLIVTAAPDILYLKDTTGDFKADIKKVLFTGFFSSNSEAQITSLRLGADNWIYANNNGQHGEIKFPDKPDAPAINIAGGDFRFRLDRGLFEKEAGSGQFGMAIDDWGHRFYTQNTLHIQQVPFKGKYFNRNSFLPPFNADVNISDHDLVMFQKTPPPYWRLERSQRRQKQYDELKLGRNEYAEGHFTGASGGTFYGGDAFPAAYYGSIFTGEVAGNLVHRDILVPDDHKPVFVAKRSEGEKDREFLASTDPWFRPANFTVGPDGCLYMIDMYRQHIETPVSIPEDLKKDMDFTNGEQYGRIFKIFPKENNSKERKVPNLRKLKPNELVALLSHPNQWWRLQAQRLLLEYQDNSVVPLLKKMFTENKDARARLHALYTLEGLNALNVGLIKQALKDENAGVRENAIMLSEQYPACLPQLLSLINDSSLMVAFQATLSLGEFSSPEVMPALVTVIQKHYQQPLFRMAVLSAKDDSSFEILKMLEKSAVFFTATDDDKIAFLKEIAYAAGARQNKNEILNLLSWLALPAMDKSMDIQSAGLTGLSKGIADAEIKDKPDPEILKALQQFFENKPGIQEALKKVRTALGDTL